MSTGPLINYYPHHLGPLVANVGGFYVATLTGTLTIVDGTFPNRLKLDPGGAARDVVLPPVATSAGYWYEIVNGADAAENLVAKNVGGDTIATANQNEKMIVFCDGATWALYYVSTIALS
jgi:hypothetical protein